MTEEEKSFSVSLERLSEYSFKVDFGLGDSMNFLMDEPEPLGKGLGPNASKVLAAAMGNCLSASLLFCLQRARVPVKGMKTFVNGNLNRNEKGRWRITEVNVEITPDIELVYVNQMKRCLEIFEDFCIVSKSIEQGIPFKVKVNWD
ncbi:OsmC family protein [Candidatus Bathyarchaeota archaeon]|nr:OsmC family protein [Candidatus Bathyarchaeota archaeon]